MNKLVVSIVAIALLVVVLGTAGFVFAQTPTPQNPVPGTGYGQGMMGGRGMGGGMMGGRGAGGGMTLAPASRAGVGSRTDVADLDGPMHDDMVAVFAKELNLSVEILNTRLTNGETMAQIATSKNLTTEQFTALMTTAHNQAIAQAVKDGTMTQEQADWMNQRGAGMANGGQGGRGGMRGGGMGSNCPNVPQVQQ